VVRVRASRVTFEAKEIAMFFAPALRTRAYAPAARDFDRAFERFAADAFAPAAWSRVKVEQDEQSWTLSLDLPGVPREDLSIDVEGTVVRIATRAEAKRQFKAAYELPEEIDADATSAKLEHGVLTLVLGKKKPVSTARQIEVK
jgi:HSP20 family molecular chaperone IbpA